jgi:hypothetical protein
MKLRRTVNQAAESLGVLLFLASLASLVVLAALLCEKQSCEIRPNLPDRSTAHALARQTSGRQSVGDFSHPDQIASLLARQERAR